MKRSLLLVLLIFAGIINYAQTTISGTVKDGEGNLIPGVNVLVKGTTIGSVTNFDGNFSISDVPSDATLMVSFIGYETQEIATQQQTVFDIVLVESAIGLDEVVAVGYGVQKKANLTGAVGSIKTDDIKQAQVPNISNSIVGKMPGIIAKQSTGEPGKDGSQIFIRGVATYQGNTTPSIIIDGIERSMSDFSQLDPNEIESVNILKDAAAAAIFGVRGANGVILIKTRRGEQGKASFSYSYNYGMQTPTQLPEFTDSYGYAEAMNEFSSFRGKDPIYSEEEMELFKQGTDEYPNTDWYDVIMENKQAIQQQHNLSAKGGSEKATYFVSLGYLDQGGFYDNLSFERFNVRSNVDVNLSKYTKFSLDLSGRMEITNEPGAPSNAIFRETLRNPPIMAAYYSNGLIASPLGGHANTYGSIKEGGFLKTESNTLLTKAEITQQIPWITGLSLKGALSYDKNYRYSKSWDTDPQEYHIENGEFIAAERSAPSLGISQNNSYRTESQFQVNYNNTFGDHEVTALAMFLQNTSEYNYSNINAWGFDNEILQTVDAAANNLSSGTYQQFGRQSYIGRLNYSFKQRYLAEFNMRRDGTENFAPDYRWGNFSSFSLGWIISEESFLKDVEAMDFLKLRGSYGSLGNDQINGDRFAYYNKYNLYSPFNWQSSQLNYGDYFFGGNYVKGFEPGAMGNEVITWETSTKMNAGVDLNLLQMLNFTFDYFTENRTNILTQRSASVPLHFGAILPMENIGEVSNKGFETSLGITKSVNKFKYYLNANYTKVKNEIVFMDEALGTSEYLKREGRPIDGYYGYNVVGIFQTEEEIAEAPKQEVAARSYKTKPGDVIYEDVTGDGVVNSDDRTFLGNGNVPDIIYGLNGGFEYKNFDFNFMLQGAADVQYALTGQVVWPFYNDGGVPQFWMDDHWTADNTDATYSSINPRGHSFPQNELSSLYIYDASYLRLKHIELGYSIPKDIISRIGLAGLRVYASGHNMLTWTKVPQVDPENTNNMGQDYPNVKTINFGVKVDF